MPVTTQHLEYSTWSPHWKRCRDVAAGQRAVHAGREAYLKKLSGMTPAEYDDYVGRALFYGATGRTVDGLSGMIFRKPAAVTIPESMAEFQSDVTASGVPLQAFCEMLVQEQIEVSRAGVLVEYPQPATGTVTRAEELQQGLRPFWRMYRAESIINWSTQQIGNRQTLTRVVLEEAESVPGDDEFSDGTVRQFRVLDLVAAETEDGVAPAPRYRQRVFRKVDEKAKEEQWQEVTELTIFPSLPGNQPMTYIPFVFAGIRDTTPGVDKPVLLDLVEVNLSHYRTTADYEHAAHYVGLPTPVITGHVPKDSKVEFRIGSATAWLFEEPEAKAFYLEFEGQGLDALEKVIARKERQMAMLGSRMLAEDKAAAETARTEEIRRGGEASMLASLASSSSAAITQAMEIARDWMGLAGDVSVELNRDYMAFGLDAQRLQALMLALQSGEISRDTFFYNLQRGDIYPPGRTYEEERTMIESDGNAALNAAMGDSFGGQEGGEGQ